jgi:hypothetical protein
MPSADSFLYPEKPLYWRHIDLSFLAENDRQFLRDVIRKTRKRPEIEIPEEVTISFGIRRRACFTTSGVQLWRGSNQPGRIIPWAEMSPITVSRIAHERRDFRQMEFCAPARAWPIILRYVHGRPTWTGADAELLVAFLQRHVPADRFSVNADHGVPRDHAECLRRIAKFNRSHVILRRMRWAILCLIPLVIAGAYYQAQLRGGLNPANWDEISWLGFGVITIGYETQAFMLLAVTLHLERGLIRKTRELVAWEEAQEVAL